MRPNRVTVGPLTAASANAICLSQTPTAGALTLNGALVSGGVATLDVSRRVLITAAGNESSRTFTLTGTSSSGVVQSETITGPNATTAQSVLDYKKVTSITISGNAAGAVTVGTSGVASSGWVQFSGWSDAQVAIQCVASGTVNYTVQQTLDDPNNSSDNVPIASVTWFSHPDPALVTATASVQGNYGYTPVYARVTLNSGTGSVAATFLQSGV
jgi:hypothetical protein